MKLMLVYNNKAPRLHIYVCVLQCTVDIQDKPRSHQKRNTEYYLSCNPESIMHEHTINAETLIMHHPHSQSEEVTLLPSHTHTHTHARGTRQ